MIGAVGAVALLGACGGSSPGAGSVQGSAASCAAVTPAQQLEQARVVVTGEMLQGAVARLGHRDVLVSPARMRVRRYLKGSGPRIVRVQTGVAGLGSFGEDGIEPAAGERWTIYTSSRRQPYETGICEGSHRIASPRTGDPRNFVYVTSGRHGLESKVELRSAETGRLVGRLATFGGAFTDNGLAVSPDGAAVYVTLIGSRSLRIERVAVADGKRTFVAAGEQPAVSPDGRHLAYVAARGRGEQALAVRDLSSGRTQTIELGSLVGRSADLLNGSVMWLAGGSDVVAIPGPVPQATAEPTGAGDGACSSATCLIVVHVRRHRLTAHRIVLSGSPDVASFAPDGSRPRSLLRADATTVERVTLRGSRAAIAPLATLPNVLPVAFSPSGAHLLYLVGHDPPALWAAGLVHGRLSHPHRLLVDARLDEAAW